MDGLVKPKKTCCKDAPRCKRCPVVLKKLERQGFAEKEDRKYRFVKDVPKKSLKAARAR